MEKSCWTLVLVLVVVWMGTDAEASLSRHMNDFIQAVKQVEEADPGSGPAEVLKKLRRVSGLNDVFVQHFLGDVADSAGPELDAELASYLEKTVHHRVAAGAKEEGVVLTPDGSTVALQPLLLGIEAGLLSKSRRRVRGLYKLTLAKDLSLSFRHRSVSPVLGPDGCWDNVTSPQVFTLSDSPSLFTTAQVNGGMDGVILGSEVNVKRPPRLSSLLTEYYCHQLGSRGMDAAPRLISRRRRENFRRLVLPPVLTRHVVKSVDLQTSLEGRLKMNVREKKKLVAAMRQGMKQFVRNYMECPPIVPRCMWGAQPYRGTPTQLSLPLSFLFIHHTHSPGEPCLTFEQCSADMRSMQRFHQDDRGWDDIGYSFVAGSDGNIYEGRGWHWQGAHTLGHNSVGYGVSFIGDYMSQLPSQQSMELVRDQLAFCAVGGGRLVSTYTLQGHRQVVDTSCPGDALFNEIRTWEHFGEVKKRTRLSHQHQEPQAANKQPN